MKIIISIPVEIEIEVRDDECKPHNVSLIAQVMTENLQSILNGTERQLMYGVDDIVIGVSMEGFIVGFASARAS